MAPGLYPWAFHPETKTKEYPTPMPAGRDVWAYTKQILNRSSKHKNDFSWIKPNQIIILSSLRIWFWFYSISLNKKWSVFCSCIRNSWSTLFHGRRLDRHCNCCITITIMAKWPPASLQSFWGFGEVIREHVSASLRRLYEGCPRKEGMNITSRQFKTHIDLSCPVITLVSLWYGYRVLPVGKGRKRFWWRKTGHKSAK